MLKMIQRMRSMTAAANFQSFLFSLSASSALLPSLMCSSSRPISSISLSVVPDVTSSSCSPSCLKFPASLLFRLLPTEDGVGVFGDTFRRSQDASFLSTNHFIWSHTTAKLAAIGSLLINRFVLHQHRTKANICAFRQIKLYKIYSLPKSTMVISMVFWVWFMVNHGKATVTMVVRIIKP